MELKETVTPEDIRAAPKPMGSPVKAYVKALQLLSRLGSKHVLDCPAGQGAFAKKLLEASIQVTCCDINPSQFSLPELSCEYGNMNESLPYEDNQFDAVTCINGLHRAWARGRAVRELTRVLKPGGHLILSILNNNSLMRRLHYLLTGTVIYNTVGPPHVCRPEAEDPSAYHRYPLTVANVASAFESVGLKWGAALPSVLSVPSICLAPLAVAPWIFLPFAPRKIRETCYLGLSSSPAPLFSDFLIIWGQKPTN